MHQVSMVTYLPSRLPPQPHHLRVAGVVGWSASGSVIPVRRVKLPPVPVAVVRASEQAGETAGEAGRAGEVVERRREAGTRLLALAQVLVRVAW